ncbi:MAG: beta-lactamase [Gemmatimonadetes bacterium]|nr:beta-lactamase [Gemmatimonadota bacterium]
MLRRIAALLLLASPLAAQNAPLTGFDGYVTQAMRDWKVPGLAIAIVRSDSIVLMKGYGTRTMDKNEPVDEHTMFAIGSASKAFTSTLVAMMVDAGKMRWDDPATKYLPDLQMFDPYVSKELTVRDMLTHRSGLSRGDLVWFAGGYDRDEILRRVRFLKPSWSVRSQFGYQNIMYLAAGQAAARASGKTWDDLVRDRIFAPLGMNETNSSTRALAGKTNVATPHLEVNDTLHVVPYHNIDNIGPAGSINSNASDMIKWVRFQLDGGKVNGKTLVAAGPLAETHTAQMVIPVPAAARTLNPFTHLEAYGMGWFLQDYRGRELDQHGGNIDGMSAMVAVMPEEKVGMVILTNANGSPLPTLVLYRALDALLGAAPRDWSGEQLKAREKARPMQKEALAKILAARVPNTKPSLAVEKYAGEYGDSLYGDVVFKANGGKLTMTYGNGIDATLEHWHYDTFQATATQLSVGKLMVTFALDADAKVKSVDVAGFGTFGRRPEKVDTTKKVVLAGSAATNLTGTFTSAASGLTVEVTAADGVLRLSVPGQPVYTLYADSPTRFRMGGPPGFPAGFFVDYSIENGVVKSLTLTQPSPQPTLVFTKK